MPEEKGTGDKRAKTPRRWQARENMWSVSREGKRAGSAIKRGKIVTGEKREN